jgi:hypothetical protein
MIRRCDDRDLLRTCYFAQDAHGWGVKKQQVPPLRYAPVGMTNGFRSKILLHSQYRGHCRSLGCAPPDFPWSLLALANLMRLSLLKAAHAVMDGATCGKSGSG